MHVINNKLCNLILVIRVNYVLSTNTAYLVMECFQNLLCIQKLMNVI